MSSQLDIEKPLLSDTYADQEERFWKRTTLLEPKSRSWTRVASVVLIAVVALFFTARSIEETVRLLKGNGEASREANFKASINSNYQLTAIEGGPMRLPAKSEHTLGDNDYASLAAASDPDGNRQVYDLTTSGQLRIRKSSAGSSDWTAPEIIPTDLAPKLGSPLTALAWPGTNGATNLRLYYVDQSNRMTELYTGCYMNTTCSWGKNAQLASPINGGMAAVWMGSQDGIRIHFVSNRLLWIAVWYSGKWSVTNTGFAVSATSLLSAYTYSYSSDSLVDATYVQANVSGSLQEFVWKRSIGGPFQIGRKIDPVAPTGFASAYGTQAYLFHLDDKGVLGQTAINVATGRGDRAWSSPQRLWEAQTDWSTPPGVAVAAIGNGADVSVFYATYFESSLLELKLNTSSPWIHQVHLQ